VTSSRPEGHAASFDANRSLWDTWTGIDTLSWARLGARVTGADMSPASVRLATSLADALMFSLRARKPA
jgi:hypothetical protein